MLAFNQWQDHQFYCNMVIASFLEYIVSIKRSIPFNSGKTISFCYQMFNGLASFLEYLISIKRSSLSTVARISVSLEQTFYGIGPFYWISLCRSTVAKPSVPLNQMLYGTDPFIEYHYAYQQWLDHQLNWTKPFLMALAPILDYLLSIKRS